MHITSQLTALLAFFGILSLLNGCTETTPTKEAETKSIQDIAKEAMTSTGKLSKEQVDALIRANAACRPEDKY
ncbi:hypothetical protein [Thiothrix lacustris]|uniref:Uncharacterized protein n=1 Tax=Thiothrix lacustris TaxID=525917 RepID=A0ABY9MLC8_9GAMM|nr:hypothetical protein [Thiothrix lacustris]WML89328.1 hypothetical protein RCF98_10130 [Thiothrix lacustris]WMP15963.1 hypothetical protein RCS87_11215 [Thiothrix lacustris]